MRIFWICMSVLAVLVLAILGQAKYEEAQISSVPIREIVVDSAGSATDLYDESGCGSIYAFTPDRFDYEVVRLNPNVDVYNLGAGQIVRVPWVK